MRSIIYTFSIFLILFILSCPFVAYLLYPKILVNLDKTNIVKYDMALFLLVIPTIVLFKYIVDIKKNYGADRTFIRFVRFLTYVLTYFITLRDEIMFTWAFIDMCEIENILKIF